MLLQDVGENATPAPPLVGTCRQLSGSGWVYDQDLLALWGVTAGEAPHVLIDPLLPVTLSAGACTWDALVAGLGPHPCMVFYRLIDTEHARVRELQALVKWEGHQGESPQVHASHMDITRSVAAIRVQERARAHATTDRLLALSRMGAAVASSTHPGELLHRITRLAAACIGGCAHLIVAGRDHGDHEWNIVAPDTTSPDTTHDRGAAPLGADTGAVDPQPVSPRIDSDPAESTGNRHRVAGNPAAGWAALVECECRGALNRAEGQAIVSTVLGEPAVATHLTVCLKVAGRVIGLLAVGRHDPSDAFDPADQGLLQVLADGAGAAVAQARARQLLDRRTAQLEHVSEERTDLLGQRDDLLHQLDTTESRQRMLVAEAVHDDPLQLIVAASLRLDTMAPHPDPAAAREVENSIDLLEKASGRLRELMTVGIAPPDLSAGLWRAVRAVARAVFLGSATTITVVAPESPMDPVAESTAYRVIREALINARKHARARSVTVRGVRRGDDLVVVVADDGVGCEQQESPQGHFGISVMRARAEAAGGSLTVRRGDGGGCEVHLVLPGAFSS